MTNYSGEGPIKTVDVMNSSCHQIEYSGRGIDCNKLTFSVEANNSIGKGESTLIHSGQPISKIKLYRKVQSDNYEYLFMQL